MLQKNSLNNFFCIDYMKENESCASTNKDSNMTSSIKGNNYHNFFRNTNYLKKMKNEYEEEKKEKSNILRIQDYMSKNADKRNTFKNKKIPKRIKNNYPNCLSKFNNIYKSNYYKNSIINKTMNILNSQKGTISSNISSFDIDICLSKKYNNNNNKIKEFKNKKLNEKCNKTQSIKERKKTLKNDLKKNNNNISTKSDFNNEQKKLDLIKKQYIKNIKKSQIIFHDIKEKMSNISHYQNNILELNNKCLKYSNLSQQDSLKKYKEENSKNLKDYKLKNNQNYKRPLSCGNNKINNRNIKKLRKKLLNSNLLNVKEKRENDIKDKLEKIKTYNSIRNECYNSLKLCNEIYEINKDKKVNFYNYLKQKIKNNNIIKKRYYSCNISC